MFAKPKEWTCPHCAKVNAGTTADCVYCGKPKRVTDGRDRRHNEGRAIQKEEKAA